MYDFLFIHFLSYLKFKDQFSFENFKIGLLHQPCTFWLLWTYVIRKCSFLIKGVVSKLYLQWLFWKFKSCQTILLKHQNLVLSAWNYRYKKPYIKITHFCFPLSLFISAVLQETLFL